MVLEAVYVQDFYPYSYGFRPGRGAHDALQALSTETMALGGGWIRTGRAVSVHAEWGRAAFASGLGVI